MGPVAAAAKCAVLSLLVHALLACLAMTVRWSSAMAAAVAAGAPIRVRIVQDDRDAQSTSHWSTTVAASAPQLFDTARKRSRSRPATDEQATDEQVVEAPQLIDAASGKRSEPAIVEMIPLRIPHEDDARSRGRTLSASRTKSIS